MGYCLTCGKLRDTVDGLCHQCLKDERVRKRRKPKGGKKNGEEPKSN